MRRWEEVATGMMRGEWKERGEDFGEEAVVDEVIRINRR